MAPVCLSKLLSFWVVEHHSRLQVSPLSSVLASSTLRLVVDSIISLTVDPLIRLVVTPVLVLALGMPSLVALVFPAFCRFVCRYIDFNYHGAHPLRSQSNGAILVIAIVSLVMVALISLLRVAATSATLSKSLVRSSSRKTPMGNRLINFISLRDADTVIFYSITTSRFQ